MRNKKETIYCYSEQERIDAIEKLKPKPEITRFKGLGEISPDEFKHFIGDDIRLDPVMLDKATFIGWQEMRIGSNPVFGIGDSKFRFKNRGNDIVSGQLSLNFTDERYLRVAITNALNPGA